MTTTTTLKTERLADLAEFAHALKLARLPVTDLDRPGRAFFRFMDDGQTVGYGGMEGAEPDMLLRSLLVMPDHRNRGHGGRIVAALEREAAALGAERLHLLTSTAARFFNHLGYQAADRTNAPVSIAACEQFRSLCPASAAYLVKRIAP